MIEPLRRLGGSLFDFAVPMPFAMVQGMLDPLNPRGNHHYWSGEYLGELGAAQIEALTELGSRLPGRHCLVEVIPFNAAVTRVPADATAFAHRDEGWLVHLLGQWHDAADAATVTAWVKGSGAAVRALGTGDSYLNLVTDDEEVDRVAAFWSAERLRRLAGIKTGTTRTTPSASTTTSSRSRPKPGPKSVPKSRRTPHEHHRAGPGHHSGLPSGHLRAGRSARAVRPAAAGRAESPGCRSRRWTAGRRAPATGRCFNHPDAETVLRTPRSSPPAWADPDLRRSAADAAAAPQDHDQHGPAGALPAPRAADQGVRPARGGAAGGAASRELARGPGRRRGEKGEADFARTSPPTCRCSRWPTSSACPSRTAG